MTVVGTPDGVMKEVAAVSVSQTSANADTLVAGSEIDARPWRSIAYTISVATNTVDWTVYGANLATFADKQVVQAEASVVAGATGTYAVAQAPYAYYCVWIHSNVGGAHGTATVNGIAKG